MTSLNVRKCIAVLTVCFFMVGCTRKYVEVNIGNPEIDLARPIEYELRVENLSLGKSYIKAKLLPIKKVPQKKEKVTTNVYRETEADRSSGTPWFGTAFSTVFYPLILVFSTLSAIENEGDDRRTQISLLLGPFGGMFWFPVYENISITKEYLSAQTSIEPIPTPNTRPILTYDIGVVSNTEGTVLDGQTFKFPVKTNVFLKDKLSLTFQYRDLKATKTLHVLKILPNLFGLSHSQVKEFYLVPCSARYHYLKMTDKERKLFSELTSEEQRIFSEVVPPEKVSDRWTVFLGFVESRLQSWLNPEFEEYKAPTRPTPPASPSLVSDPIFPEMEEEIPKSFFENREMFEARIAEIIKRREEQTANIHSTHKKAVAKRNRLVEKLEAKFSEEWMEYEAQLHSFRQKEMLRVEDWKLKKERRFEQLERKKSEFLYQYFCDLFEPKIDIARFDNGDPKYDAEKELMYTKLWFTSGTNRLLERQVVFSVPPGEAARKLDSKFKKGSVKSNVDISFVNDAMSINSISISSGLFNNYDGVEHLESIEDETQASPLIAFLSNKSRPAKENFTQMMVSNPDMGTLERVPSLQLVRQSDKIQDRPLRVLLNKEFADYDDDIPALLNNVTQRKVDSKKWLFVIGIENYQHSAPILHSKRSAEMFIKVAMRVLGIPPRQVVFLSDDGNTTIPGIQVYIASAGSLKDRIHFLERDLSAGDTLYFYYSGHGIPLVDSDNEPYCLAVDQAPDFIGDDPFFKVQNIYNVLSQSRAKKVIAFMDSCFTGTADGASVYQGSKAATVIIPNKVEIDRKKMVVITAGTRKQFSNMYKEKGHRLFSYHLMKALLEGHITVEGLFHEVHANTRTVSKMMGGSNLQEPTLSGNAQLILF